MIPEKFKDSDLNNFDSEKQPKAYKLIKNYDLEKGESIILYSPDIYGVGKTHLAYALLKRYIREYPATRITAWGERISKASPVCLIKENDLLMRIRATFQPGCDEKDIDIYRKLRGYKLLVIDDVGKKIPKDYNFVHDVYFTIIDDRDNDSNAIMITTNLAMQDLEVHIGGAAADRLRGMCGKNIIQMTGKSQRWTNV